jgi:Flp pilus assembly CpaF family ATPase
MTTRRGSAIGSGRSSTDHATVATAMLTPRPSARAPRERVDQRRHQHGQDKGVLNALAAFLPPEDRVVLIEDTAELHVDTPNVVRFEARREQADVPAVTIRDLLRATLRHRPDRIIVGEVRGAEAFDLLQALNTGHAGTLSTIHANSAEQALTRLASCVLQSEVELPYQAIRHQIGDTIGLVLHLARRQRARVAAELLRIGGYDTANDRYNSTRPFAFDDLATQKVRQ